MFDLKAFYDHIHYETIDGCLSQIHKFLELHGLNLDPDYQRGHVWSEEQAGKFVAFLFGGGETSRILITTHDGLDYEVLDGKQRLTAVLRFLSDEIPMVLESGERVYLHDCDAHSVKIALRRVHLPFGRIQQTRAEAMKLYIRLNAGGTVHTPEEIERVKALLNELD